MKKYLLAFALIGLIPATVSADTLLSSKTTIQKIFTYKTAVVLKLTDAMPSNEDCTYSKSGKYVALRFNEESKELFSTLLSAYIANQKVEIGTNDCDDIWHANGTMNKVYRVSLTK